MRGQYRWPEFGERGGQIKSAQPVPLERNSPSQFIYDPCGNNIRVDFVAGVLVNPDVSEMPTDRSKLLVPCSRCL